MAIHPTAVIDSRAVLAADVSIGPFTVIEGPVRIESGTVIGPHVHLLGATTIGANCRIHAGVVIGDLPQDRAYQGEESFCRIGAETTIREYVTIHRGTKAGTETVVGDRCLLMAHAHVAHNCQVGDDVVLVNGALLAGYVQVGPRAMISGNAGIHQFARVGELTMIGGLSKIVQDTLPYFMYDGPGYCVGINVVGLRRAGYTSEERLELKQAYRRLYRTPGTWNDAVRDVAATMKTRAGLRLLEFLQAPSKRGFHAQPAPRNVSDAEDEAPATIPLPKAA